MKNFGYKLIAILLIALCIWPIIGGISVGDYDLLIGVITCLVGYILWKILDKKLLTQLWEASKRPDQFARNEFILSSLFLLILFGIEVIFVKDELVKSVIWGLQTLLLFAAFRYRKLWKRKE